MSNERKQILQMLAEGKVTADEAGKLLDALGDEPKSNASHKSSESESSDKPKFLHIQVAGTDEANGGGENVNIKIPIFLLKAGIKLGGMVPGKAQARVATHLGDMGLDLNDLDAGKIDEFIKGLTDGQINIVTDKEAVRIFCK